MKRKVRWKSSLSWRRSCRQLERRFPLTYGEALTDALEIQKKQSA